MSCNIQITIGLKENCFITKMLLAGGVPQGAILRPLLSSTYFNHGLCFSDFRTVECNKSSRLFSQIVRFISNTNVCNKNFVQDTRVIEQCEFQFVQKGSTNCTWMCQTSITCLIAHFCTRWLMYYFFHFFPISWN